MAKAFFNTVRLSTVLACLLLLYCGPAPAEEEVDWAESLTKGYSQQDRKPLLEFLESWHKESKPVPEDVLQKKPAIERSIYELYQDFYKPAERFYETCQYVIIQDSVDVIIVEGSFGKMAAGPDWAEFGDAWSPDFFKTMPRISHLRIMDFRPRLQIKGKKILYLDDSPLAAMLGFLTGGNGYKILNRYWEEDCEGQERRKRLQYLNSALKIFRGHWGRGWHFVTHPHIRAVYLSSDGKEAIVCCRVYYGGDDILMVRRKDGWKVVGIVNGWSE